ncbi:YdcF family protein [Candidatus Pacearchaeota archaeon]|nr:YdcF family protein [Candidatus Pacearchaeota archaeon]
MRLNKKIGALLLVVSFVFFILGFNFNLTGNFIKDYFEGSFLFYHLIGLIFFIGGLGLLVGKRSLDYLIIPIAGEDKEDLERTKRAEKEKTEYYIISGHIDKTKPIKYSQTATIYKELRKQGIKPSEMKIESKSKDTLENAIYSLGKVKEMKTVGIISYPKHLERFKMIINQAKEEGRIPKNIKIKYLPTEQTFKEWAYGTLANIKERYRLRKGVDEAKKHKTGKFGNFIKKIVG